MVRRHDAPGQGFLFPDESKRVNKITPAEPHSHGELEADAVFVGDTQETTRIDLPASIDDLAARCGLTQLNTSRFGYRAGQVECILDICTTDRNFAVKGALGSGKTNVALAAAARTLGLESNVLYLAPFDNLVAQTAERAAEILTLPDTHRHSIRDAWAPNKRSVFYSNDLAAPGGHLVIATPGKILNDITEGRLSTDQLRRFHLVIFDECHLAFGDLPYVELMRRFKSEGARLLGFTGTMGKDKEQRAVILQNLGVSEVYTISTPPLRRTVLPPRILELEPAIALAAEQLTSVARKNLEHLVDFLDHTSADFGHADVGAIAANMRDTYLTGPRFSMPVKKSILALHHGVRQTIAAHPETGPYFTAVSLAHAVDQVQQLHDRLTRFGRCAFLRLAADKMLALNISELRDRKEISGKAPARSKVPRYVEIVYTDDDVVAAYNAAARGTPFDIVPELSTLPGALRAIDGPPTRSTLHGAELRKSLVDSLRSELVLLDYSDHPKEAAVFSILAGDAGRADRKPTIIFVELVESAAFLVDRIHSTKDIETKAVLCVGSSHAVSMPRAEAIRRFDAGEAHVIVATSALETGQDTQTARRVINFIQTPEAIRLAQRMGRAGRSGLGAEIVNLVTKHYEPQYFAGRSNIRTMEANEG